MKHHHTSETTDRTLNRPETGTIKVHPSVLSILFYLEELEAQVPIKEYDLSSEPTPATSPE